MAAAIEEEEGHGGGPRERTALPTVPRGRPAPDRGRRRLAGGQRRQTVQADGRAQTEVRPTFPLRDQTQPDRHHPSHGQIQSEASALKAARRESPADAIPLPSQASDTRRYRKKISSRQGIFPFQNNVEVNIAYEL